MAGTSFGLPTRLLNVSSPPSTPSSAQPAPILPIPPAPSFANFRFHSIGQQPRLLQRFSEPDELREPAEDETMSVPSDSEQQQNNDKDSIPWTRPSLLQALSEPNTAFVTNPHINDSPTGQAPVPSPFRFPVARTTVSNGNISSSPPNASKGKAAQADTSSASSTFLSSSVISNPDAQISMPTSPIAAGHTGQHAPDDSLAPMRLSYPSPSPGPSGTVDYPMTDIQRTHTPDHPSLLPVRRKYEGLRQIYSRLHATVRNLNPPNLASAILLTESAQERATNLLAEARRLHSFSQETMQAAQRSLAASAVILEAADQVKAIADGAKAELERISSKDANQQRNSELNEVRDLLQSLDDWISNQEADEAVLRVREAQQLKLGKQKAEFFRASAQHVPTPSLGGSPTTFAPGPSVPAAAPAPARMPLFYSPTPEVDVKVDLQTLDQSPPQPTPVSSATVLSQRQADLRKKLEEKRRSSIEAESQVASSETARLEQQRMEEEKKRQEVQQREEERKREEQRQKELERQEEERKARERAQQQKAEAERRARETAETERRLREAAELENVRLAEAQRKAQEEEARRKAREAAEKKKKEQEAAEEEKRRKAQEAAEAQRKKEQAEEEGRRRREAEDFLAQQKQEQEKVAQAAEEAKLRALQDEQEGERRLLEEQARMKIEREREKLRKEQEIRRQQISDDKKKAMTDRALQIQAQREHRPRTSLDRTSEMSLDSSPVAPVSILSLNPCPTDPSNSASHPPPLPLNPHSPSTAVYLPLGQRPLSQTQGIRVTSNNALPEARNSNTSNTQLGVNAHEQDPPAAPVTPGRQISLPPVAHFSPTDSSPPPLPPLPLPSSTWSVYRQSNDSGNVPYKENPIPSPQAQAANIRHVVRALQLPPPKLPVVKVEPAQDDFSLLHPPAQSAVNNGTPIQPAVSQSRQPLQPVNGQSTVPHQDPAPTPVAHQVPAPVSTVNQPVHLSPATPMNDSQTNTVLDHHIPSSSVTNVTASVNAHPQQSKNLDQLQVPSRPTSRSSSRITRPESQNEPLQLAPPTATIRSRSSSPSSRMGPYIPSTETAFNRDISAPRAYRGRTETSSFASGRSDHYSPSPQPPPAPRNANTYRPSYSYCSRSPTIAGRKRSRERSNSPPPSTRNYRDDRRSPPRRYSRSPPRHPRTHSRSPSPSAYSSRPPLASRIGDDSYRPPSPRRESTSSLLNRFSDPRSSNGPVARPGRGRPKRGRGGGGPPGGSLGHASLQQRISSGTALANRLEDPPRRP